MILPIPVELTVEEINCKYDMNVEELNQSMDMGMDTGIVVAPVPSDIYERLDHLESQEPYWNDKYDSANPPPYPVRSVDNRLGHVTLGDLYDKTDKLSYVDIASIFD